MGEANAVKKNNFIQMLMRPQVLVYVILIIMLIIANIVSARISEGKTLTEYAENCSISWNCMYWTKSCNFNWRY